MPLPKERSLSQEEVMRLVDAAEESIERPSKGQQDYYSGKKKQKLSHDSHQNWIRLSDSEDPIHTTFKRLIADVLQSRPGLFTTLSCIKKRFFLIPIHESSLIRGISS
jgi:hypothetical protein